MFEFNTDRMFWTIAVLILGATLLMIGNRAFPKTQESIMSTISQNVETANNTSEKISTSIASDNNQEDQPNPDSNAAKKSNFEELKTHYKYNYNSDGTINLVRYNGSDTQIDIPKWGPSENSSDVKDAVKVTQVNRSTSYTGVFDSKNITSVNIPNSITSIGSNAFYKNELVSVTIPNSVKSIGGTAFAYNKLKSVNIPNSVTDIGWGAFTSNQLTSVDVPKSVTNLDSKAFDSITKINKIN